MMLPNFKDIFIRRLLQHNIVPSLKDTELFCDNLYDTGAYVAGSFILDCLFNTNYHRDIDIYDQTGFDLIPKQEQTFLHECCQEEKDRKYEYYCSDKFDNFESKNLRFTQSLYKSGFRNVKSIGNPDPIIRSFLHKSNPMIKEKCYNDGSSSFSIENHSNDCIQIIPIDMNLKLNERSVL